MHVIRDGSCLSLAVLALVACSTRAPPAVAARPSAEPDALAIDPAPPPVAPRHGPRVEAPHTGLRALYHTICELLADGTVRCAGGNEFGELGNGSSTKSKPTRSWSRVSGVSGAVDLTVGLEHACVRLDDGTAKCWGANPFGQLGDGTFAGRSVPVPVERIGDIVELRAGEFHTCARTRQKGIWCWGGNLGGMPIETDPPTAYRMHPAHMPGLDGATQIVAGYERSYVRIDGTWLTWTMERGVPFSPKPVLGLNDAVEFVSGPQECIITREGSVKCWGSNSYGALGADTAYEPEHAHPVEGIGKASKVATGSFHTCALVEDGGLVYCWGDNDFGQLGDRAKGIGGPARIPGIEGATDLATGLYYTCARARAGVRCFGDQAVPRTLE